MFATRLLFTMFATRLFASVLLIGLFTACAQSPQTAEPEETPPETTLTLQDQPGGGDADAGDSASDPLERDETEAMPENRLPSSVLGTFDQTQEACSSDTFTQLTVTEDKLQFYYGYADIESVTLRDGGYDIDATFFQLEGAVEVRPEAATYRIESGDQGDSIRFENTPTGQPPSLFVRCDKA